jgi:PAS domain S-box-containing protein
MAHERILVVENETIIAMDVCGLLEKLGYEPLGPVVSGEEAVAKVRDLRPDAVLMDIVLNGSMDGIQAAEIIQPTYHCPVIFVTAHLDQSTLDRAKLTNPFGYIIKPFSERELHVGIDVALYRHRMEERLREAEETLKESEERYRTAIESCNDGVAIVRGDEQTYVNRRFLEMFGYESPEEILGEHHFIHVHPDDRERVMETNRRRQKGEPVPSRYEFKGIRKDGSMLHVEVTATEISYQGAPGSLAYLRDITEQKRAEELFEELFQSLPIAAYVYVDWQLVMANEHQESLTGYTRSDLQELSSTLALVHPNDRETVRTTAIEMLKGKRQSPYEYRMVTKQGQVRWVMESITSIEYNAKRAVLVIFMDITERKLLETQLVQAQKLESIGQLAAGIAHEINTPTQYVGDNIHFLKEAFAELLTLIAKYRELLDAAKAGEVTKSIIEESEETIEKADISYLTEEIPKAIQQSMEGVERVTRIVRAMKEFSHPGKGEKALIDINKAIENTIMVSRNEWKYVSDVVTEFDPELPLVPCLPGEFNQVILNAAHALAEKVGTSAEKGSITISTMKRDAWAEIRISDTGPGIPEEIQSRVFDPFFTTKEVGKGTGQGLAIARSIIVDKHGGSLAFETEAGKGTTFIIRMPLGDREAR